MASVLEQHSSAPSRARTAADYRTRIPVHVVWELTLACDLKCAHCGSRAGKRRPNQLSTTECLQVVDQLAALGTREISLIGGEAYLRPDWLEIVEAITGHGIYCALQTGARNLSEARIEGAVEAGLKGVGVSLDGLEALHDRLRGVPGSFRRAVTALKNCKTHGLSTSVNTQIGAETMDDLPALLEVIADAGVGHWQMQLTVAMGNAVDNDHLLLQPHQLQTVMPLIAELYHRAQDRDILVAVGNNVGYFGPYEHFLRGYGEGVPHWASCGAGSTVMGIEADGAIKGCPSLETRRYTGGNVRQQSIEDIWRHSEQIGKARLTDPQQLWGFCAGCYYADACRAGCTWTAGSLLGEPGNNPYCHYRVERLAEHGLRESVRKVEAADTRSFAVGRFEIVLETVDGRAVDHPQAEALRVRQAEPAAKRSRDIVSKHNPVPKAMHLCKSCHQFVWPDERVCPFCQQDIEASERQFNAEAERRRGVIRTVEKALEAIRD